MDALCVLLGGPSLVPLPRPVLVGLWVVASVGIAFNLLLKKRRRAQPDAPAQEPSLVTPSRGGVFGLSRATVEIVALVTGIVVLFGGFAALLVYVDHADKEQKRQVTTAMHDLQMGSTPLEMRRRLGEPYDAKVRKIDGQRAFCLGWSISVYGDADLRWACYVHGRRVR
jgi:hypothetical protein